MVIAISYWVVSNYLPILFTGGLIGLIVELLEWTD